MSKLAGDIQKKLDARLGYVAGGMGGAPWACEQPDGKAILHPTAHAKEDRLRKSEAAKRPKLVAS